MKSEYHGIYAALVTPYTSEGKVDYRELQKLVDYLICQGLEGFYVNGSTAEAFLLSEEERNSTIRAVVEANSGRAKVICCHRRKRKPAAPEILSDRGRTARITRPALSDLH